jgi:hypothetical protein
LTLGCAMVSLETSGYAKLLFIAKVCGAILMVSCSAPHTGPKLIAADGVTYAACGGALWVQNENPRNIEYVTFEVLYQDAQGINHELKGVRMLNVTDLDSNSPACRR